MSVLLDEETVVLDSLDFEVPCNRGEHAAEVMVRCRSCGSGSMLCRDHLAKVRQRVEEFLAARAFALCKCADCGDFGFTFDELVEVVPL
ncbi:hypothetical protein AB0E56_13210 [Microbacterium sp. NPDC028030]|uniref:hypothetical protein n=1 Tax=Microbacterium sp. NPDC028030 TaxID=3155124 RepID=UPI0033F8C413